MSLDGKFNDFEWTADINEDELEDMDGGVSVEVITPTGGKIGLIVYGPWLDIDGFSESVEEDTESYVDIT